MERVLEGAVEHGLTITRDRVQALAQAASRPAGQRQRARPRVPSRGLRRLLRRRRPVVRDDAGPGVCGRSTRTISVSRARCARCSRTSRPKATRTSSRRSSGSSCRWARPCWRARRRRSSAARATPPARPPPPPTIRRRPRRSDPDRPQRGLSHRGAAGAEGRDARAQQLARHRAERVADRLPRKATTIVRGWRRPTAARARASSACAAWIWPSFSPAGSRAKRR